MVGAWQWLPQYELGLITEIDHAEAYRPLTILRWAFFSIFGLLAASSVAIFVFTLAVARLQREAQKAAIEAKQLGQYRLEDKLGAGAMGVAAVAPLRALRIPVGVRQVLTGDGDLTLVLASGTRLRLGDTGDLRLKLAIARRILPMTHGATYVDVSVPERPVAGYNPRVEG